MNSMTFTALAEPNRLHIVEFLRNGPQPVGAIVTKLKLNQPQVSKHLRILADAGIVDMHPVANQRIYGLHSKAFKELDVWLEKYRTLWENRSKVGPPSFGFASWVTSMQSKPHFGEA